MKDLARQVWTATAGAILIFALFEIAKAILFPNIGREASHVMTAATVGVLTFFVSRYALSRYHAALGEAERQARITQETNRLLSAAVANLREGVLIVNSQLETVLHNEAAARIFRFPSGEGDSSATAWRLAQVVRDPVVNTAFRRALEEKVTLQDRVDLAGRENRIFQLFVSPLGSDLALGVLFDITDLERLESVRREFFANLSHELRTPLTSIIASAESLMAGAADEPENRLRFINRLYKHAMRMSDLITDILDLSAIESGGVQLELGPVDLRDAVDEVIALNESRAAARSVSFNVSVPEDIFVRADKKRLEQILHNLIDNAVKFNREGGSVTVEASMQNGRVVTHITDSGAGIPPEDVPRVFERLYRTDKSRSRKIEGSGLGLAIVKHLVQAHGGQVTLTSNLGRGSCFSFTLPTYR
jgi:two-component system phosphate regulon sensor histidine kinase PhoR